MTFRFLTKTQWNNLVLLLFRSVGNLPPLAAQSISACDTHRLYPAKPFHPPTEFTDKGGLSVPLRIRAKRCFPNDPQYNSSACSSRLTDESPVGKKLSVLIYSERAAVSLASLGKDFQGWSSSCPVCINLWKDETSRLLYAGPLENERCDQIAQRERARVQTLKGFIESVESRLPQRKYWNQMKQRCSVVFSSGWWSPGSMCKTNYGNFFLCSKPAWEALQLKVSINKLLSGKGAQTK